MVLFIILLLLAGFFFGVGFFDCVLGDDLMIDLMSDHTIIFMLCFIIALLLVLLLDKML